MRAKNVDISAVRDFLLGNPEAGRTSVAKHFGVSSDRARHLIDKARANIQPASDIGHAPPSDAPSETSEIKKDEWALTLNGTRIHTLEQLIAHCKIDLTVWEIERFVVNKWEVGAKDLAGNIQVEPLYQVKAWLVKKGSKAIAKGDKVEFLRQFREILASDASYASKTPAKLAIVPDDKKHREIAAVAVSDLHLTETVSLDDSNLMNRYNSVIAASRLWEHAQKVKSILARHMKMYRISEVWSPLMGDIVNGTVHEEYIATNDLSDPAAVVLGARLLAMFYREIASLGLPVTVDAVHGNHARLTPKMPTKRQAHTNLDWLLYEMLADILRSDKRITVNICTAQLGMKKVFGWNYIYEHGIDVKNGAEEAFEDRVRALFDDPTYREATGYSGSSFDQIVIGNMHKPKFLERTIVNGSYIGQNELGQSWRLKPIRAQQLMWGISEKHPRTWQYQIDLTSIKQERTDNPFGEYAAWFVAKHGR